MASAEEDARQRKQEKAGLRHRPDHIRLPGAGQESVWEYPRPPRVEPVTTRLRVEFSGLVVADTTRGWRVLETANPPVYYFPPEDVRLEYLQPSDHHTVCEWKGRARYWSLRVGGRSTENAAWSYPDPEAGFETIRDALAFYPGLMDACYVGPQRVTPQPGHFYGGWITGEVVGPFKGEPGTESW
ncbi:MAG: DUF427 domain-containing protein [Nitrospirales bacterium]